MHIYTLDRWKHSHDFSVIHKLGERRTLQVLILTALTMMVEIIAGSVYGSMALLADGWHMGTHVASFFVTIFAYRYARKNAKNPAFTFGTGKVSVLGGFTSAIFLASVALVMVVESVQRIFIPHDIHFDEAIIVAAIGLVVNIISAFILLDGHNNHDHHDHNLKAAYFHVLADALTSVLAMIALFSGKYFGGNQLDPIMAIVGAAVITRWAYGLIKETSPVLLDGSIKKEYKHTVRTTIEKDSDNRISDMHIWKIGPDHYAAIISIVTHYPKPLDHYKKLVTFKSVYMGTV
jgi:cation diffusion facilitator family transporter